MKEQGKGTVKLDSGSEESDSNSESSSSESSSCSESESEIESESEDETKEKEGNPRDLKKKRSFDQFPDDLFDKLFALLERKESWFVEISSSSLIHFSWFMAYFLLFFFPSSFPI